MRISAVLAVLLFFLSIMACGTSRSGNSQPGGAGGGGGGGSGGEGGAGGEGGEQGPTAEEICQLWAEGHVENDPEPWTPGETFCAPGTLSEVGYADVLRRINLFRELAGLPPVTEDRSLREREQACAIIMHANEDLSHDPPPSWNCWTEEGHAGAASSNLSLGYPSPSDAINGQMRDVNVESVGHRRWLLGFFLGKVGIGSAGIGTCIGVFDDTGTTDTPWTAFPHAGPVPIAMVKDPFRDRPVDWSFHPADGIDGAEVFMHRLPEEEPVEITSWIPERGFMIPDAIAWRPPPVEAGESYRITITRPAKEPVVYQVDLVDCQAL